MEYRAIVHFHFKKGMEDQGLKFLENELVKKAKDFGLHGLKLLRHEKDHTYVIGIASWKNIEEARKFQSKWQAKEKELAKFCTEAPHHDFFKKGASYLEKARKAA